MIKRRSVRFEIEAATVQLTKAGDVEIMCKDEVGRRQSESELIQKIGVLLLQCLASSKEDLSKLCRKNNESDLIELVSGLVNRKFDEQDEGYEGDFAYDVSLRHGSSGMRQFRNLEDIRLFCDERLHRKNIASGNKHYRNVIKALYYEAYELKSFLDHVTSSLSLASEKGEGRNMHPSVASTAQECVHEWARFWLQVMHELRRGVHLRKVSQTKISPEEYELLPHELVFTGETSTTVAASRPNESSSLPENAREIILDFISSKQGEKQRLRLLPYMEDVGNLEGKEDDDGDSIEDDAEVTDDEIVGVVENRSRDVAHRKPLKVESPLWDKIKNWDASLESLLSNEKNCNFEDENSPESFLDEQDNFGYRRNSYDLGKISPRRTPEAVQRHQSDGSLYQSKSLTDLLDRDLETPRDTNENTAHMPKKRLAVSAQCFTEVNLDEDHRAVGTSLFEIAKTRQAIATAEADLLPKSNSKSNGVRNGSICFSCKKSKFSFFTSSYQCHVCSQKFCSKCIILNVEVPNHLVDTKEHGEIARSPGIAASKGLSKSLTDLVTGAGENSITPFPCKRQSLLQISSRRMYGGKIANMCQECKVFIESIITETKNLRWHVGMTMDI